MFELVVRVVFSLSVILGLLWLVARASNRRFGGPARSMVRVLARQPLARSASLAVVEVGDRVLVVGVSEQGVSLLTEMDPAELPAEETVPGSAAGLPAGVASGVASGAVSGVAERLGGSLLSAHTWRQAWAAATARTGGRGG